MLLLVLLLRRRRRRRRRRSGSSGGRGSNSSARPGRRRSRPGRRPRLLVQPWPRPAAAPVPAAVPASRSRRSPTPPPVRGLAPGGPRPRPGRLEPLDAASEDGDVGRAEGEHPAEDQGVGDGDLKRERDGSGKGERTKKGGRKEKHKRRRRQRKRRSRILSLFLSSPLVLLTLHPAGRSALRAGTGSISKATTWREPVEKGFQVFFLFLVFQLLPLASKKGLFTLSLSFSLSPSFEKNKQYLTVRQKELEHPPADRCAGVAVCVDFLEFPGFEEKRAF